MIKAVIFDMFETLITHFKSPLYFGKQIAEDIKSGTKVLFIGIACDVIKIKNMVKSLKLKDDNVIYVDLVCNGPADPEVAVQFVDMMEFLRKVPWSMIRGTAQLLVKLCLYLISTGRARMEIFGMTINLHKIHSVLQTLIHLCDTMIMLTAEELRTIDISDILKNRK